LIAVRNVYAVPNDDPSWDRLNRHGITGVYVAMEGDGLLSKEYLHEIRSRGFVAGLYQGHNWHPGESGVQAARRASAVFKAMTTGANAVPGVRVQLNWEQHDQTYILQGLREWRRLHPKVNTSWSMEGMQGGWMGPVVGPNTPPSNFVQEIVNVHKVRWVPQTFIHDMSRQESDVVLRDLLRRGVPENVISMFYPAADLGIGWDGWAFTEGLLP
jgi:hypothetical protein